MHSKAMTIFLVLLLLCSQLSIASVPECVSMQDTQQHDHQLMADVDHSHHMMMDEKPKQQESDCCGADCRCPQGISSSLALVSASETVHLIQISDIVRPQHPAALPAHHSQLIKPPAFA